MTIQYNFLGTGYFGTGLTTIYQALWNLSVHKRQIDKQINTGSGR
jgi:hypothetical protein